MSGKESFTFSSLSLSSDDWDRSETEIQPPKGQTQTFSVTPRNSVIFPADSKGDTPGRGDSCGRGERSPTELMKLHAEKGTDVTLTAEEASRVADVLKQWINSATSPYEAEDDFFSRAQDDSVLSSRRASRPPGDPNGRLRGLSESMFIPRSPKSDPPSFP
ncbi:hypothetical protein ID866_6141 [Astraeus odoratus]|nr:hypothetical protein ID866_6141 [Astraeus odoratus]